MPSGRLTGTSLGEVVAAGAVVVVVAVVDSTTEGLMIADLTTAGLMMVDDSTIAGLGGIALAVVVAEEVVAVHGVIVTCPIADEQLPDMRRLHAM